MKKIVFVFTVCVISAFISSCRRTPSPEELEAQHQAALLKAQEEAVSEYAASLSDEQRISQLFLVNIEGSTSYHAVERTGTLYGKNDEGSPLVPGGVLLFSYNVSKEPSETYGYIKSIRDFYLENENIPPFVAVDQEGGDVNRLRGLTGVLWSQKKVSESLTQEKAGRLYSAQARQMRNLGFHMNLAPVVEVENESNREFLGTRTFGNLENVLSYGKTAVEAYEKNGIGVVLKHFPGNSSTDPHIGLPKITYSLNERDSYFKPFEELLPDASAVLMSHAIMKADFPNEFQEEGDVPACFSRDWILLSVRKGFGFSGLVLSDDIFMGALAKNGYPPEKAVVMAISAGVDVIMLSEKRFGHVAGILLSKSKEDESLAGEIDRAVKNVIRYKIRAGILEFKENPPDENGKISFSVCLKENYPAFDEKRFNEDLKDGMEVYN